MSTLTESQLERVKNDFAESVNQSSRLEQRARDDEHRRQTIESGAREYFDKRSAEREFEDSRELREEIERRFPGRRTSEVLEEFVQIEAALRRDPVNTAHELAERYLRAGRFGEPEKPKAPESRYPENSIARDVEQALQKLQREKGELERMLESRKRLGGASLRDALKRILDIDAELAKQPWKAAARLAASYGMPLDESQAAAQQRYAAEVQRLGGEALKGRAEEAAELVRSGRVAVTGDPQQDVAAILKLLSDKKPNGELRKDEARPLKKAVRAQEDSSLREELRRQLRAAGGRR